MFKRGISKIHSNISKSHNLQNKLQIDEILDFCYFQVNDGLECLINFHLFPIIIKMHQTSNVKV
jgi:hypothetical protein